MTQFESQTCTRCGGSGHYSWNAMHGSMCYGCGGTGHKLTKRGLAAQNYFNELCSAPVSTLVPGMAIRENGKFREVLTIQTGEQGIDIELSPGRYWLMHLAPESLVRVAHSSEAKAPKIAAALAFQETLTKSGTVRKQKERIAA